MDKIDQAVSAVGERSVPMLEYTMALPSGRPVKVTLPLHLSPGEWMAFISMLTGEVPAAHAKQSAEADGTAGGRLQVVRSMPDGIRQQ